MVSFIDRAYGSVYKAQDKRTGSICAVKIVSVEEDVSSVQKEIDILKTCQSPNIVSYIGSYYWDTSLWVGTLHCVVFSWVVDRHGVLRRWFCHGLHACMRTHSY